MMMMIDYSYQHEQKSIGAAAAVREATEATMATAFAWRDPSEVCPSNNPANRGRRRQNRPYERQPTVAVCSLRNDPTDSTWREPKKVISPFQNLQFPLPPINNSRSLDSRCRFLCSFFRYQYDYDFHTTTPLKPVVQKASQIVHRGSILGQKVVVGIVVFYWIETTFQKDGSRRQY
jgi:hypothetical protein